MTKAKKRALPGVKHASIGATAIFDCGSAIGNPRHWERGSLISRSTIARLMASSALAAVKLPTNAAGVLRILMTRHSNNLIRGERLGMAEI